MRYRVLLLSLLAALSFSSYMFFYTSSLPENRDSVGRMFIKEVIPYKQQTPSELAMRLALAVGDGLAEMKTVTTDRYCEVFLFETKLKNMIQIGYCTAEIRVLVYENIVGLETELFRLENTTEMVSRILQKLASNRLDDVSFVLETTYTDSERVTGYQMVGDWRIHNSGFLVSKDLLTRRVQRVVFYDVFSFEAGVEDLPPPTLASVKAVVEARGVTYREPFVSGLWVCRNSLAYSVLVLLSPGNSLGYQVLIDAYTGDVLSLDGLSRLGVFEIIKTSC